MRIISQNGKVSLPYELTAMEVAEIRDGNGSYNLVAEFEGTKYHLGDYMSEDEAITMREAIDGGRETCEEKGYYTKVSSLGKRFDEIAKIKGLSSERYAEKLGLKFQPMDAIESFQQWDAIRDAIHKEDSVPKRWLDGYAVSFDIESLREINKEVSQEVEFTGVNVDKNAETNEVSDIITNRDNEEYTYAGNGITKEDILLKAQDSYEEFDKELQFVFSQPQSPAGRKRYIESTFEGKDFSTCKGDGWQITCKFGNIEAVVITDETGGNPQISDNIKVYNYDFTELIEDNWIPNKVSNQHLDMSGVKLENADLSGAIIDGTSFEDKLNNASEKADELKSQGTQKNKDISR